jgi:phage terminase large subunit-like protein
MIEGESGILSCAPKEFYPEYVPTLKKLIWPNGVVTHIYYGTEPDKSRGPQSDLLWCDEIAKWQYAEETFDNLLMGLRLGSDPRCLVTSTPRPTKFLMDLEKRTDPFGRNCCVVTKGNTKDNYANLAPTFLTTIIAKYEGTRLGKQELEGEFLDDNPDALWRRHEIDNNRVPKAPDLSQIVVGVDPSAKSEKTSDDTGIIVVGKGHDGHGYVLEDATIHGTPKEWATQTIASYSKHKANWIVAEVNQGGEMVEYTIRTIDANIPYKPVHATRGKEIRAEPISSLYQQGRIHHVGTYKELEEEMCEWMPNSGMKSPNRIDALVWAVTALNLPVGNVGIPKSMATGLSFHDQEDEFRGF